MKRLLALPPAALAALAGLAVLAAVGWGMLISTNANHAGERARWNDERAELAGRTADLEGTLEEHQAASGDLANLRLEIDAAREALNQRMTTLKEREQDLAAAEAALGAARAQLGEVEQDAGATAARLSQRLQVLGTRERDAAVTQRALWQAESQLDRARQEAASLETGLTEKRATLGALNLTIGELDRQRSKSATALERVEAQLAATQTRLVELEAQLDRALLAKTVAQLSERQKALSGQIAELNAQLDARRPLLDQSVRLSQELVGLNQRFQDLMSAREHVTQELGQLVQRIAQPQAKVDDVAGPAGRDLAELPKR